MTTDGEQPGGEPPVVAGARRPRTRDRWLVSGSAAVVLGIVATSLVVVHDRHAEAARARSHRHLLAEERAYLAGVRWLARRLDGDLAPVQRVVNALSDPQAGDLYAARDALANDSALRAVDTDLHRLSGLRVPRPWRDHAADLRKAVTAERDAVHDMRSRRSIDDFGRLNTTLQETDTVALWQAGNDWRNGLAALFTDAHRKAPTLATPADADHTGPSLIGWVFEADRACIRANIAFAPLAPRINRRPVDLVAFRQLGVLMQTTFHRLTRIPAPTSGDPAFRRDVVEWLTTIRAFGGVVIDLADAAMAHDQVRTAAAYDRFRTLLPSARELGDAFRRYHALACVALIAPGNGKSPRGPLV